MTKQNIYHRDVVREEKFSKRSKRRRDASGRKRTVVPRRRKIIKCFMKGWDR